MNLFVYGTLQSPRVFRMVTGEELNAPKLGYVQGFMKVTMMGLEYPWLVRGPKLICSGRILENVREVTLTRLAKYEGSHYHSEEVNATLVGQRHIIPCSMFVPNEVIHEGWDLAQFERNFELAVKEKTPNQET